MTMMNARSIHIIHDLIDSVSGALTPAASDVAVAVEFSPDFRRAYLFNPGPGVSPRSTPRPGAVVATIEAGPLTEVGHGQLSPGVSRFRA